MPRVPTLYLATLGALLVGVGIGYGASHYFAVVGSVDAEITREGGYQYINPLLSCDISEDTPESSYAPVVRAINAVVQGAETAESATRVSVYFREMNSGKWTGVNPDGLYAPASLMKVPLYVAYLKESQTNPQILQSSVLISAPDSNQRETIKPAKPLIVGRTYSVDDALRAMIVDSDNNAAAALNALIPNATLADVYGDFGLPVITDEDQNLVSPKMYTRLFRILYNSSYIWRGKSQSALELMTQGTFSGGIVAGLPAGTPVSHKFGEREIHALDGTHDIVQLHDCGIVYYPRNPYALCVMTEGTKIADLAGVIAGISRATYDAVQTNQIH